MQIIPFVDQFAGPSAILEILQASKACMPPSNYFASASTSSLITPPAAQIPHQHRGHNNQPRKNILQVVRHAEYRQAIGRNRDDRRTQQRAEGVGLAVAEGGLPRKAAA